MPIETFRTFTDLSPKERITFHDYTVDVTAELMAAPGTTMVHQASCHDGRISLSMRPQLGLVALDTP